MSLGELISECLMRATVPINEGLADDILALIKEHAEGEYLLYTKQQILHCIGQCLSIIEDDTRVEYVQDE
jgi:hypothetical protein